MKPLTGKYAKLVYQGEDWSEHYSDKFRARRAVMLAAVNKDWTYQDCELVLLDPLNAGSSLWLTGSDDRPLRRPDSLKRLRRDFEAASTYRRDNPGYKSAADARAYIGELKAEARSWHWKNRYDRDILRFFHAQATWVGCDRINVSVRAASLGAGCSLHTAHTGIHRLIRDGWLERAEDTRPAGESETTQVSLRQPMKSGRANLYRVKRPGKRCPTGEHITCTTGEDNMFLDGTPTEPAHEVWVRLGKVSMDVYSVLNGRPVSVREAARKAAAAKSTVHRTLPVLAAYGLARKTDDGWVKGPCNPDQVVENMGWIGVNSKSAMRALQYQDERLAYKMMGKDAILVNDRRTKDAARMPLRAVKR